MSIMTVTGSLAAQMAGLVNTFNGAQLNNKYDTGTSLLVYNYPFLVNLYGYDLRVPGSGDSFITGTITKFSYKEVSFAPAITFTDKLVLDQVSVAGSSILDLISRDATTATGKFDLDLFMSFLASNTWEINGSDEDDVIGAGAFFNLSGNEVIRTGKGADVISAGAGNDLIVAGAGNDTATGGDGQDRVLGKSGNDMLNGGRNDDVVNGGTGRDYVHGNAGNDRVLGGGGADVVTGGNGQDTVVGGSGNDKLKGGKGNDQLRGGKGNDRLEGGAGADTLTGGTQSDVFVFGKGDGRDKITDFNAGTDRLELSNDLFAGIGSDAKLAALAHLSGTKVVINFDGGERLVLTDLGSVDALAGSVDFIA